MFKPASIVRAVQLWHYNAQIPCPAASLLTPAPGCRRNELVALNMVVGVATAALTLMTVVAGIFGMNLYPLPITGSSVAFTWVICGMSAGAGTLFFAIIGYAYWKRLLHTGAFQGFNRSNDMPVLVPALSAAMPGSPAAAMVPLKQA